MRPTMWIRVWVWLHWIAASQAGRKGTGWRLAYRALAFWDVHLNLCARWRA